MKEKMKAHVGSLVSWVDASWEEMKGEIKSGQAEMKSTVSVIQEKLEATIHSIWSKLEESIEQVDYALSFVNQKMQGLSKELTKKIDET
jgi:hypothetical protein